MTNPIDTEVAPGRWVELIIVHNVWTIYGVDDDGDEIEEPIAQASRPQDWGDRDKWHYEFFKFDWTDDRRHYLNHVHCWTDLRMERWQYPRLFAPQIVQVLIPGSKPQLCGRDYLASDDFWNDEWGERPPFYEPDQYWFGSEDYEEGEEE